MTADGDDERHATYLGGNVNVGSVSEVIYRKRIGKLIRSKTTWSGSEDRERVIVRINLALHLLNHRDIARPVDELRHPNYYAVCAQLHGEKNGWLVIQILFAFRIGKNINWLLSCIWRFLICEFHVGLTLTIYIWPVFFNNQSNPDIQKCDHMYSVYMWKICALFSEGRVFVCILSLELIIF